MDAAALQRTLTAESSPLRAELSALIVDHTLEQPLGAFVDVQGLLPLVERALSAPNVERAVERHVLPGFRRVVKELEQGGETVGDAVPAECQPIQNVPVSYYWRPSPVRLEEREWKQLADCLLPLKRSDSFLLVWWYFFR